MTVRAGDVAAAAAEATITVPGVIRLDGGTLHQKATYGASGRVEGVTVRAAVDPVTITVHVVVAFGVRIPELAQEIDATVRAALDAALPGGRWVVSVDVSDIEVIDADSDSAEPDAAALAPPRRQLL